MHCSCWYLDENGNLQKRDCDPEEKQRRYADPNLDCGFIEGKVSQQGAEAALQRKKRQAAERRREKEARSAELLQESEKDDARFLQELNHGRTQRD